MAITRTMTIADIEALGEEGERYEILEGVLTEVMPGNPEHSLVIDNIYAALTGHVRKHRLGRVLPNDPGFVLEEEPETLLGPDLAFIRTDRLPPRGTTGFARMIPDLAIEVVSPSNRPSYMHRKRDAYKRAGVPLIWFADPDDETVLVDGADRVPRTLRVGDVLDGEEVVPGFRLPVAEIFA